MRLHELDLFLSHGDKAGLPKPEKKLDAKLVKRVNDAWQSNKERIINALTINGLVPAEGFPQGDIIPITHEGSSAKYILEYRVGDHKIFLSYFDPEEESSIHFHRQGVSEIYIPVEGQLYINDVPIVGESLLVKPGDIHQATTRKGHHALTLIVMSGVGKIPDDEIHVRLDGELGKPYRGKNAFDFSAEELPLKRAA